MVTNNKLSAGYGFKDWLYQRITAITMLIGILALFIFLILAHTTVNQNFVSWQKFFSYKFVKIFSQIVFTALVIHAWVGIRDLWMDYIKCYILRICLYTLTIFWLLGCFIYSVMILWF